MYVSAWLCRPGCPPQQRPGLTRTLAALPSCTSCTAGLALVIPNVQSLTADYHHSSSRGQAFGTLWLTISVGGMLGALYATNTAAHDPLGIEGWRFVFFSVAVVRCGCGAYC